MVDLTVQGIVLYIVRTYLLIDLATDFTLDYNMSGMVVKVVCSIGVCILHYLQERSTIRNG